MMFRCFLLFSFVLGSSLANPVGIKDVLEKCLKLCPEIVLPVCDNEGITHNNKCIFEIRKCVAKENSGRDITLVHKGVCEDKREQEQEYGIKDVLNKCIKTCPRILAPVCDNEGFTHNNPCEFEVRQCVAKESSGRDLTIVHEGVCTDRREAEQEYGIKDVLNKCIKTCPRVLMPVCDNEGFTHNNLCEFEVRQCVAKESSGRDLTILHEGVCTNRREAEQEYGIKDVLNKCIKACPRILAPVCDNEGFTHGNPCEFEVRQCVAKESSGRDLTIVHGGVCTNRGGAEQEYGIKEVLNKCIKTCPKILMPVCDNEGFTHNNPCEFDVRQCVAKESSGRDLTIVHKGVCTEK